MTKWRLPGTRRAKTRGKPKKARGNMKVRGLSIDIPTELDLSAGAPIEGQDQAPTVRIPKDIQELFGPLIEMATNAWRLKVRMVDPESGEPKEETRKLYRFVEGLFRALDDAGIQVIDKTGKPYDNGMSEKVISFEQTSGLLKEEIIETVRPSIRWKEQPLFHGEIVVGIPVIESAPGEASKTEIVLVPSEAGSDSTQPAEAAESPPTQSEESPDPDENKSPEMPELDVVASDGQAVATQDDSGPDQSEAANSVSPSGQEAESDVAEDESASTDVEDTQEQKHLVGPKTAASPVPPEQAETE